MNNEFEIIKKYFTFPGQREDVIISGGDDCACVSVPDDKRLLITTDTLIAGVHFPVETSAEDIAYKAVMVNLSDLAAMGASPSWLTLAISLPEIDEEWLSEFSNSMAGLLKRFDINLIGGDTTRGKLSITIQAMGLCDTDRILRRDQARPGDKIFVTGDLGDAAIGLQAITDDLDDDELQPCITRLNRPEARVDFATALTSYSSCAIDISDGLVADLGHILEASSCGASILLPEIPRSSASDYYFKKYNNAVVDWPVLLTRGDDYELCFTVKQADVPAVNMAADRHDVKISCIGEITESKELVFLNSSGAKESFTATGFKHF